MILLNHSENFTLRRIFSAFSHLVDQTSKDWQRAAQIPIAGITLDSRKVKSGDVFCAVRGEKVDGKEFIASAIEQGASAILVDADKHWQSLQWINQVPVIAIENLSQTLSAIAGEFYANPSHQCRLVGVTGTNGKTSCTLLIAQLSALINSSATNQTTAVVGTLGFGTIKTSTSVPIAQQIDAIQSTGLTTPDAINLQSILAQLINEKASIVAIEVSSHALVLGRVAALQFDTALFTNLTQDHLDFHGDMKSYGDAKASLLQFKHLKAAVINWDDAWCQSLHEKIPVSVRRLSYSLENKSADLFLTNIQKHRLGVSAELHTPWGSVDIQSPFLGEFNLSNLLGVIAVTLLGFESEILPTVLPQLAKHIPQLQAAPGRMQMIVADQQAQDIGAIVDYAHTPDALEKTLKAIRQHLQNQARIWTVFGCGGDRDKTKRPLMGRLAEDLSDCVLVTNDNPRTEDPASIAADIVRGMRNPNACIVIADRAQAIDFAVQQAKAGDVVLIAGKGHENYQIFADHTLPFSDIKQARLALQRRIAKHEKSESLKNNDGGAQ